MNVTVRRALRKADETRRKLKLDMFQPVNPIDACTDLGLDVRFIDISMEGMYVQPTTDAAGVVILSSLRPMPRRAFTCAHELGHHLFNHGTQVDNITTNDAKKIVNNHEEFLVDCFAGALLMPIAGIEFEFAERGLALETASPVDFFTVASTFGVGYSTLISHCEANGLISDQQSYVLQKQSPVKILKTLLNSKIEATFFKIFDGRSNFKTSDLEVSNFVIVPSDTIIEGNQFLKYGTTNIGDVYRADCPGIARAIFAKSDTALFLRVQKQEYVGLSEYRFLED